jgi:hypothetical protein
MDFFKKNSDRLAVILYLGCFLAIAVCSYLYHTGEFIPYWPYFLAGVVYVFVFLTVRNKNIGKWHIWVAVFLLAISFFSYPSNCDDPFRYLFDGELIRVQHFSPYRILPVELPPDQYSKIFYHVWWAKDIYSPYGPLWQLLMAAINFLSANTLWLGMAWLKLVDLVFLLACARLIAKKTKSAVWGWLFLINPVLIVNTVHSPHTDIFILFLLLAALGEEKLWSGSLTLAGSFFVKTHAIIFAPLWLAEKKDLKLILKRSLILILAAAIVGLFLQFILKFGWREMITSSFGGRAAGSKYFLLKQLWPALSDRQVFSASLLSGGIVYAAAFLFYFFKKIDKWQAGFFIALIIPLLLTGLCYPWHFIIPLGFVFMTKKYRVELLLLSFFTFLAPLNIASLLMLWLVFIIFLAYFKANIKWLKNDIHLISG